jgi:flagellar motor switch protein FliG
VSGTGEIQLTGKRKAAILLVLLGDDVATNVYQNLPETELRVISQEIALLEYVSPEVASKVLQEYHELSLTQDYLAQGGPDYASKLLVKAFGEEGARSLIDEVSRAQELSVQSLDALQKTDPHQLAKFIQGEHPQTIALVVAHLNPRTARAVIMLLPEKVRGQAVKRLAQMQQFSPEMVKKISVVLHRRLVAIGQQSRRAYGGVKAVADLLNQVDQEASKSILETIEQDNAQLATSIRNLMFTFEDFLEVAEPGLRELLGQVDKKTLAVALKGGSEDVKNHFFKCMSSRAVEMLKEDMESLGPIRSREVNTAQQEVVTTARRLEAEGKMVLKTEQEESYVV